MASYCSEQQEHGCLQLAHGTAKDLVATSGVSLERESGLSIATIKNEWSCSPVLLWLVV